jgi:hypothetical protein
MRNEVASALLVALQGYMIAESPLFLTRNSAASLHSVLFKEISLK